MTNYTERVNATTPGTRARYDALRLWAIKARVNPSGLSADDLEAMFAAGPPVPQGGGTPAPGLTREDVEAIARSVYNPAPRVVTLAPDGTRRELPEGEHVHPAFARVLSLVASGSDVWLHGPAGSGKTTLARQVAAALGRPFYADGSIFKESRLLGSTLGSRYFPSPFFQAFTTGGVWLADEIDASDPTVLVVLNQALANRRCAFPGSPDVIDAHPNFVAIAGANTVGTGASRAYSARETMDAATLDRFAFVSIGYDETLETRIAPHEAWTRRVQELRAAAARVPGCTVLISPRASIRGGHYVAFAVANGATQAQAFEDAEEAFIFKGCPRAVREAILAA